MPSLPQVRFCTGTVDITDHNVSYFDHLIEGGIEDEITRHYAVRINRDFARFFKAGLWASPDIEQRRALYSTHTVPAARRYETLAGIIGLNSKNHCDVKVIIRGYDQPDAGPD